jgi:hypothetical protein
MGSAFPASASAGRYFFSSAAVNEIFCSALYSEQSKRSLKVGTVGELDASVLFLSDEVVQPILGERLAQC